MKRVGVLWALIGLFAADAAAFGFVTPYSGFRVFQTPGPGAAQIKGIQVFGRSSGIAYTADTIYRTDDNGETWRAISLPVPHGARFVSAWFAGEEAGTALAANDDATQLWRLDTGDGGLSWKAASVELEGDSQPEDLTRLDLDSASYSADISTGRETLTIRAATSSNFRRTDLYTKLPGETKWKHLNSLEEDVREWRVTSLKDDWEPMAKSFPGRIELGNLPSDPVIAKDQSNTHSGHRTHSDWFLTQNGSCAGYKTGCVQTTRLYKNISYTDEARVTHLRFEEITPPEVTRLNDSLRNAAKDEAVNSQIFSRPPGGSVRTSLNRGFDKCTNGTVSQMQAWWDNSYFFDANIYFSGRNRACSQTLSATWVNQVSAQGWGLIPTVVGYQSPCTSSATSAKFSYDPATAETQGRGEADIAAADAANIGLTTGSVLYYDMERYDETAATPGCRAASTAFLKGWTERIREFGYISGVYGSPRNAIDDWQFMPPASRMDAVWMARWDNVMSVWTYLTFANFPNDIWNNHQRIKQWQAPHNETWGGVTFNIDGNIADGPVAGVALPRNKRADFDGDGRTDISVFRPSTGQWFVSGTLGPSFNVYEYGTAEDILTPGDYDGDGRTDLVVFRQSNSTWYLKMKGAFNVRQYGEPGDIPAPADYDGDGRTDIALFRPSTGVWYIAYNDSRNSFGQATFGQSGDRPASADYDGDGKADIAVWRPSNGTWYVQGTAGNFFAAEWGVSTDIPAQADYDGDGRVDLAVFRPSLGRWYILQTAAGMRIQDFGVDGDLPATGDFDGDGRYDVAVFRPSNNTWYASQSQAGYTVREFGAPGDKTIPGAYLPR